MRFYREKSAEVANGTTKKSMLERFLMLHLTRPKAKSTNKKSSLRPVAIYNKRRDPLPLCGIKALYVQDNVMVAMVRDLGAIGGLSGI